MSVSILSQNIFSLWKVVEKPLTDDTILNQGTYLACIYNNENMLLKKLIT